MDIILSFITVIVSLIALWQTRCQVKLSNLHALYNKRLANYLMFSSLIDRFEALKRALDGEIFYNTEYKDTKKQYCERGDSKDDSPHKSGRNNFGYAYAVLSQIEPLVDRAEIVGDSKSVDRNDFFISLSRVKATGEAIEILWEGSEGKLAKKYVDAYVEMLHACYNLKAAGLGYFSLDYSAKETRHNKAWNDLQFAYSEIIEKSVQQKMACKMHLTNSKSAKQ